MSTPDTETRDSLANFFKQQQSTKQYSSLKHMTRELDREASAILNQRVRGRVLCIGGIWDFFQWGSHIEQLVALDLSPEMLEQYCPERAERVVGDLYTHDFQPGTFDTVVFALMLHHTPQGDWRSCQERVREAVRRARCWLKPGGQVIILEYCPHPAWNFLQRILLPVTKRFLGLFGQPFVVMYTRAFYQDTLQTELGSVESHWINPKGFNWWVWYPIFMSIRWLRMPFAIYPKLHVFIGKAP